MPEQPREKAKLQVEEHEEEMTFISHKIGYQFTVTEISRVMES